MKQIFITAFPPAANDAGFEAPTEAMRLRDRARDALAVSGISATVTVKMSAHELTMWVHAEDTDLALDVILPILSASRLCEGGHALLSEGDRSARQRQVAIGPSASERR